MGSARAEGMNQDSNFLDANIIKISEQFYIVTATPAQHGERRTMKMKHKSRWMEAFKEALEKDKYGEVITCPPCRLAENIKGPEYDEYYCDHCVCEDYVKHNGAFKEGEYPCIRAVSRTAQCIGHNPNWKWSDTHLIRTTIRDIMEWLERQEDEDE